MTVLLDTSVLVDGLLPDEAGPWAMSVITLGELRAGVATSGDTTLQATRLSNLTDALEAITVIDVDRRVADRYAELRAAAGRRPSNDLWIAATALAHDMTLVTADRSMANLPLIRAKLVV